jgi:hypothetical protein
LWRLHDLCREKHGNSNGNGNGNSNSNSEALVFSF